MSYSSLNAANMFFFFGAAFFLAPEALLEEDALLAEAAFFCLKFYFQSQITTAVR